MKKNIWVSIVVAIILIIVVISYVVLKGKGSSKTVQQQAMDITHQNLSPSTPVESTQSVGTGASDTSDASINQDLSNIDTQMKGLSSDSTSADSSLNNQ